MLWTYRNDVRLYRLYGLFRDQLPFLVIRLARSEQLGPQRSLLLLRRWGKLPDGSWVDNEGRDGLHGGDWHSYRASPIDQPLPLLPLLPDHFLPFLVLPFPLLLGTLYVPLRLIIHDLLGLGLDGLHRFDEVRGLGLVRRERHHLRRRRRRLSPCDHRKRFEWFKRWRRK